MHNKRSNHGKYVQSKKLKAGRLLRNLFLIACFTAAVVFGLSAYVAYHTGPQISGTYTGETPDKDTIESCRSVKPQCILVLGCAVWDNNQPSPMLRDRMDAAIALYREGVAPKLLLTGDNSVKDYSEPDCMLAYALSQGVPKEDIFLDFAGFSTYDSIYRAKAVFQVERCIVVTQKYHLFRALWLSETLGISANGFSADQRSYAGREYREAREVLARDKDMLKGIRRPEPKFLGDAIPIDGDGTVTQVN